MTFFKVKIWDKLSKQVCLESQVHNNSHESHRNVQKKVNVLFGQFCGWILAPKLTNCDLLWGGLAEWAVVLVAVGGSSPLDCDNNLAWTSASVVASTASSSTSSSIFGILSRSWDEIVLNLRGIKLGRPLIPEAGMWKKVQI